MSTLIRLLLGFVIGLLLGRLFFCAIEMIGGLLA